MTTKKTIANKSRTRIGDLPALGQALSDDGLRLVVGGRRPQGTIPSSYTPPGQVDTATDE